jgi:hypothetical protein
MQNLHRVYRALIKLQDLLHYKVLDAPFPIKRQKIFTTLQRISHGRTFDVIVYFLNRK